jgi:hypothetical protein
MGADMVCKFRGGTFEFTPLGDFALRGLGTAVSLFAVPN